MRNEIKRLDTGTQRENSNKRWAVSSQTRTTPRWVADICVVVVVACIFSSIDDVEIHVDVWPELEKNKRKNES